MSLPALSRVLSTQRMVTKHPDEEGRDRPGFSIRRGDEARCDHRGEAADDIAELHEGAEKAAMLARGVFDDHRCRPAP